MPTQDSTFEMYWACPTSKDERLDLLPEPDTCYRFSHLGTRGMVQPEPKRSSRDCSRMGLVGAFLMASLGGSLLPQVMESAATRALSCTTAASSVARFAQEWQKYECSGVKILTQWPSLFRNTMKNCQPYPS